VVWIGSCTEVWVPSWWCYWEVIGPPGLTSSVGESINDLIAEWAVRRWGLPGGSGHCGVHLKGMSICKSLPLPLTLFLGHHEVSNSTLPHTPRHDGLSDPWPRSNGARWSLDWNLWNHEPKQIFLLSDGFCQVYCHTDEKLTNTGCKQWSVHCNDCDIT
jgi:hypothetical protein